MQTFQPHLIEGERGTTVAGIISSEGEVYEICPLGREKDKNFVSQRAAEQLSEAHAATATRNGLHYLVNVRRVG